MPESRRKAEVLRRLASRSDLTDQQRDVLREAAGLFEPLGDPDSQRQCAATQPRPRRKRAPVPSAGAVGGGEHFEPEAILWTDGAARGNPGPAGLGAILKNRAGETLASCSEYHGHCTNNVAEYAALLLGLRRALELGIRSIEIRADSELLVRQLGGYYRVNAPQLKPLYHEARQLLGQFEHTRLRHVSRELNVEADRLANEGIDTA
jgi:ribonuclease HI